MNTRMIQRTAAMLLLLCLLSGAAGAEVVPFPAPGETEGAPDGYTLLQAVVLSRHHIRSPLSGGGSVLGDITPHSWFQWTSSPSELSLRGGILETMMGQYFRLWLEKEGLFPENYRPEAGAVRLYANAKQRTIATARYFAAGLLPVAQTQVETHAEYDTMDPVFSPVLHFVSDEYNADVLAQIAQKGGDAGIQGIQESLRDRIALLMDVTDMLGSESYRSGTYGDLLSDEISVVLEQGQEPRLVGPIRTATSVADALVLQYYEEADETKAAFGHTLTRQDWQEIHSIVDEYSDILFGTPLIAVNAANPLLKEIRAELIAPGRKFTFLCGHDSNLGSVLSALGAEPYLLPDAVEQHTPIGGKLVFERWADGEGKVFCRVRLVYQSPEQLRGMTPLSLEEPPSSFTLTFSGLQADENVMIPEDAFLGLLDSAIGAYDDLLVRYGIGEELDEAA